MGLIARVPLESPGKCSNPVTCNGLQHEKTQTLVMPDIARMAGVSESTVSRALAALNIKAPFDSAEAFTAAKGLIRSVKHFDAIDAASDVIARKCLCFWPADGPSVPGF